MAAEEFIRYCYAEPSAVTESGRPSPDQAESPPRFGLRLTSFHEEAEAADLAPVLFMGRLTRPALSARSLTALSAVAAARYTPAPFALPSLYDPIINVGGGLLRFEAFSGCAGVYAAFDVLPEGLDGSFLAEGSTNVDFNSPMLAALGGVGLADQMSLCVGPGDVAVGFDNGTVVERQVPLPERWLRALGVVPVYLAGSEFIGEMSGPQAVKMCRNIPLTGIKGDHYLIRRGSELTLSTLPGRGTDLALGGLNRLHLAGPLLASARLVKVFAHPSGSAVTWRIYLDGLRFSLTLSRSASRGFSGEGAGLNDLVGTLTPETLAAAAPNRHFADGGPKTPDGQAPAMAAMGLLGYDLDGQAYFHRRLPFKLGRLLALNPRLKNAGKLLAAGKVEISFRADGAVEGRVEGSGVWHSVLLSGAEERCTCLWSSKYRNSRGPCKHILAVKEAAVEAAVVDHGAVRH